LWVYVSVKGFHYHGRIRIIGQVFSNLSGQYGVGTSIAQISWKRFFKYKKSHDGANNKLP
jgi:hypothetical protein